MPIARLAEARAATTSSGRFDTITPSAWTRETSAPCPIASDTSALASTGASLMPSPTMATRSPRCWAAVSAASLSWGDAPPRASSAPRRDASARAREGSSPDRIVTLTPSARSAATASAAPSRKASSNSKHATAQPSQPSQARGTSASASWPMAPSTHACAPAQDARPSRHCRPSASNATRPWPATSSTRTQADDSVRSPAESPAAARASAFDKG